MTLGEFRQLMLEHGYAERIERCDEVVFNLERMGRSYSISRPEPFLTLICQIATSL